MIFNHWRKYPRRKPKKDGRYFCTVSCGATSVDVLYYSTSKNQWIDSDRQAVFDGYVAYKVCRAPIQENRVYTDRWCDRTEDVIAWKKLPRGFGEKKKRSKP